VASKIKQSVIHKFGESMEIDEEKYYAFPFPNALANARIDKLRECGLSKQKAGYIKGISERVDRAELDLESLKNFPDDKVIERLMKVKGMGPWTTRYLLARGLGRNINPSGYDLAVRKVISKCYFNGRELSIEDVKRFVKRWGQHEGRAIFYLLVAYRSGILGFPSNPQILRS